MPFMFSCRILKFFVLFEGCDCAVVFNEEKEESVLDVLGLDELGDSFVPCDRIDELGVAVL